MSAIGEADQQHRCDDENIVHGATPPVPKAHPAAERRMRVRRTAHPGIVPTKCGGDVASRLSRGSSALPILERSGAAAHIVVTGSRRTASCQRIDAEQKTVAMSEDTLQFQAEVGRLLHLMVHSVYSNKEIFLRELISNASDACDRLRYAAIAQPELMADGAPFGITITTDKAARTLTVADNGIGMNRDDLVENLGTIA